MERKISWITGCHDEIELVYEKAEQNQEIGILLSELEQMALTEAEESCGLLSMNGKPITREMVLGMSEQAKESIMYSLSGVGLDEFVPSMSEPKIVVRFSPLIRCVLGCTMFSLLNRIEKIVGSYNVLFPKATLELQVPLGGRKGMFKWTMLIMQLYPWLSVSEVSYNAVAVDSLESAGKEKRNNDPSALEPAAETSNTVPDDVTFIREMKHTSTGLWQQYDVMLLARGYGWEQILDWADYMTGTDIQNIAQVTAGYPGSEKDITGSYRDNDCKCCNTPELKTEASILSIAGASKTLKVPMKIVWFNQTKAFRLFTLVNDETLIKKYAETMIRRTFGTNNAMKLWKDIPTVPSEETLEARDGFRHGPGNTQYRSTTDACFSEQLTDPQNRPEKRQNNKPESGETDPKTGTNMKNVAVNTKKKRDNSVWMALPRGLRVIIVLIVELAIIVGGVLLLINIGSWIKHARDVEEVAYNAQIPYNRSVYVDIVSVDPEYLTKIGSAPSAVYCECRTYSGETLWIRVNAGKYGEYFDSSVNFYGSYLDDIKSVYFTPSIRIHGVTKKSDNDTPGTIQKYVSVSSID